VLIEGDATHPSLQTSAPARWSLKPLIDKGYQDCRPAEYRELEDRRRPNDDGADPDEAEQQVDSVLAMSDGVADGVAAALAEQGFLDPLSGQDGNKSALNRIAKVNRSSHLEELFRCRPIRRQDGYRTC